MELSTFGKDVLEGLSSQPKRLSSRYFYDEVGDDLFRQIMGLDEYYLTRAEMAIFREQKAEIQKIIATQQPFRLVELGAGDGVKTVVLLKHFAENHIDYLFSPIDISPNVLDILEKTVKTEVPDIEMEPVAGDYFEVLKEFKLQNHRRSVIFFLGSNIGNFQEELSKRFLNNLHQNLSAGDLVMIGFDLKKDPATILKAYNDPGGITRAFNLNLLSRINRELGGDFKLDNFTHYPIYQPDTGECRSYLISKEDQKVEIESLGASFHFRQWEPVLMEISRKFNVEDINSLAINSGFRVVKNFFDPDRLFCESIWEVV